MDEVEDVRDPDEMDMALSPLPLSDAMLPSDPDDEEADAMELDDEVDVDRNAV